MRYCLLLTLLFVIHIGKAQKKLSDDIQSLKIVTLALDQMYNFDFEIAKSTINKLGKPYEKHPAAPYFLSMCIKNEYYPILKNSPQYSPYLALIEQTLYRCQQILDSKPNDPEALFFSLAARGDLALFYSKQNELLKVIQEIRIAYSYMKTALQLKKQYSEFYFFSGLYYFYLEQYPITHPSVKPFMILFEKGNKAQGFADLKSGSQLATFTQNESLIFLSGLYNKYETRPDLSLPFIETLVSKYPNNLNFTQRYFEVLIELKKYDLAMLQAKKLINSQIPFFQISGKIYETIVLEKTNSSLNNLHQNLLLHLNEYFKNNRKSEDLLVMTYSCMARICIKEKNYNKAKAYYQKVIEKTENVSYKKEADDFFKNQKQ